MVKKMTVNELIIKIRQLENDHVALLQGVNFFRHPKYSRLNKVMLNEKTLVEQELKRLRDILYSLEVEVSEDDYFNS